MPAISSGMQMTFSPPAFRPTFLSGCVNWYRADRGIILNGGVVETWEDQSGMGRHLTQATATKRPPWNANGAPGGRPYVGTFDASNDFLRVTYTQAQPEHVFCVSLPSVGGSANKDTFDGATGNTRRLFTSATTSVGIFAGTAAENVTTTTTAWHRLNCEFNGASSALTVDDTARESSNIGSASSGGLIVGCFGDQVSNPGDIRIAELFIYNRILSAAEVARVKAYLVARYGF